jgi:3-methyladenine DNA glycosylase AlkC
MKEKFLLRNVYNEKMITDLADRIINVYSRFEKSGFIEFILSDFQDLNFGERALKITSGLEMYLPQDYLEAIDILTKSLGPEVSSEPGLTIWEGFYIMPVTDFAARNGLMHFNESMQFLYEATKRFSSESAIRPFILKYPEKSISLLKSWVTDKNVHVRRLVSEGTRPRLPLGIRLPIFQKKPEMILELLDLLKDDSELYVRRSVANNLNDISKDNPKVVINILKEWQKEKTKNFAWIANHSLRTLLKKGDKQALSLLGFKNPEIKNCKLTISNSKYRIGDNLEFSFEFISIKKQKLMIDYAIHYVKANGKLSKKVFKFINSTKKENEKVKLKSLHSLRQMTTRKHYPGIHFLEIFINGIPFVKKEFQLIK